MPTIQDIQALPQVKHARIDSRKIYVHLAPGYIVDGATKTSEAYLNDAYDWANDADQVFFGDWLEKVEQVAQLTPGGFMTVEDMKRANTFIPHLGEKRLLNRMKIRTKTNSKVAREEGYDGPSKLLKEMYDELMNLVAPWDQWGATLDMLDAGTGGLFHWEEYILTIPEDFRPQVLKSEPETTEEDLPEFCAPSVESTPEIRAAINELVNVLVDMAESGAGTKKLRRDAEMAKVDPMDDCLGTGWFEYNIQDTARTIAGRKNMAKKRLKAYEVAAKEVARVTGGVMFPEHHEAQESAEDEPTEPSEEEVALIAESLDYDKVHLFIRETLQRQLHAWYKEHGETSNYERLVADGECAMSHWNTISDMGDDMTPDQLRWMVRSARYFAREMGIEAPSYFEDIEALAFSMSKLKAEEVDEKLIEDVIIDAETMTEAACFETPELTITIGGGHGGRLTVKTKLKKAAKAELGVTFFARDPADPIGAKKWSHGETPCGARFTSSLKAPLRSLPDFVEVVSGGESILTIRRVENQETGRRTISIVMFDAEEVTVDSAFLMKGEGMSVGNAHWVYVMSPNEDPEDEIVKDTQTAPIAETQVIDYELDALSDVLDGNLHADNLLALAEMAYQVPVSCIASTYAGDFEGDVSKGQIEITTVQDPDDPKGWGGTYHFAKGLEGNFPATHTWTHKRKETITFDDSDGVTHTVNILEVKKKGDGSVFGYIVPEGSATYVREVELEAFRTNDDVLELSYPGRKGCVRIRRHDTLGFQVEITDIPVKGFTYALDEEGYMTNAKMFVKPQFGEEERHITTARVLMPARDPGADSDEDAAQSFPSTWLLGGRLRINDSGGKRLLYLTYDPRMGHLGLEISGSPAVFARDWNISWRDSVPAWSFTDAPGGHIVNLSGDNPYGPRGIPSDLNPTVDAELLDFDDMAALEPEARSPRRVQMKPGAVAKMAPKEVEKLRARIAELEAEVAQLQEEKEAWEAHIEEPNPEPEGEAVTNCTQHVDWPRDEQLPETITIRDSENKPRMFEVFRTFQAEGPRSMCVLLRGLGGTVEGASIRVEVSMAKRGDSTLEIWDQRARSWKHGHTEEFAEVSSPFQRLVALVQVAAWLI